MKLLIMNDKNKLKLIVVGGKMKENNIFKFATKELSQDAFIAWMINWLNKDDEQIKKLSKNFLKTILKKSKIAKKEKWINIIENNRKFDIDIEVQFYNIDVLAVLHDYDEHLAFIIEDKVNTLEHDMQIQRYKDTLTSCFEKTEKYKNINKNNLEIVTCYYKPFDECGIDNKEGKEVDCVFTREKILELIKNEDFEHQYFKDYKEYIETINKCAENYKIETDNEEINDIIEKKKYDIKYLAFFKNLEKENKKYINEFPKIDENRLSEYCRISIKEKNIEKVKRNFDRNEQLYYGISSTSRDKTWWCNIPIKFIIESPKLFNRYAFIKINFYKKNNNATVRLKASKYKLPLNDEVMCNEINSKIKNKNYVEFENGKKVGINTITEYEKEKGYFNLYNYYDARIFKNNQFFQEIKEKLKNTYHYCINNDYIIDTKKGEKIKLSGVGNTKTQSEINIFTINIQGEKFAKKMEIVSQLIECIKNDLDDNAIKVWCDNDNSNELKATFIENKE